MATKWSNSVAWDQATTAELKSISGVCLDIDDTLTTEGKLTSDAYAALWDLKNAGLVVVPITGRPAGWCDHFARFWPVDAVVGENGAFTFFMDEGVRRRIETPSGGETEVFKQKLLRLGDLIQKKFKAHWASDQAYREYDLAIDICEDVAPWPKAKVDELLALCEAEGAHAKLSSIHVNAWYGEYDKRKGFEYWLSKGGPGLKARAAPTWDQWLFIGDSPNDEPLFASFKYSVGVANIKKYMDRLKSPPRWTTVSESGRGFAEMVNKLVAARK
ncbi:MAG: HAD-IIB family hydrolase [Bdellovibrionota bacterium]